MEYEIIANDLWQSQKIFFKYQYLYANKPLLGADKYIVIDRRDIEAWFFLLHVFRQHTNMGKPCKYERLIIMFLKSHEKAMMKLREIMGTRKGELISSWCRHVLV